MRHGLLLAALACSGCASLVDVIPPDALTDTRMTGTRVRIDMYLKNQADSRLPTSLDVLPAREGYDNETVDGWNRPLIYRTEEHGFTLTSLGKDGVPGGNGPDADIVKRYRIVDGEPEEVR